MIDHPVEIHRGILDPIDGAGACARAADLAEELGQSLYILAYTPDFCGFVTPQDARLEVADLFELRCFCEGFELRWMKDAQGQGGKAVILSEGALSDEYKPAPLDGMYKRPVRYVLWGKGRAGRLFDHRIGELVLPSGVEVPEKGRVFLDVAEYFQEDIYGNLRWHSERLVGFSPVANEPI